MDVDCPELINNDEADDAEMVGALKSNDPPVHDEVMKSTAPPGSGEISGPLQ